MVSSGSQWKKIGLEAGVIGGVLLTTIPPSQAVFGQQSSVKGKYLEEHVIQETRRKLKLGDDVDTDNLLFHFNKGL